MTDKERLTKIRKNIHVMYSLFAFSAGICAGQWCIIFAGLREATRMNFISAAATCFAFCTILYIVSEAQEFEKELEES